MSMDEQVRRWLTEAERDLEVARILAREGFNDRSVFHAQQAAEKALKALYISVHGELAPKTHRVDKLAEDMGAPGDLLNMANYLTADYTASRYPDAALAAPSAVYTEERAANPA